eukprot:TRINITY_DN8261_c0_g1_i1.p1 TRINITY_DN8261_c0_g1~~TRINITY_DN8261_c0_g1_i1.p1  ORF type:complete len:385 (+),score=108.89 TRINITY_DN8261_c0_g1_i1:95-1156(+)
MGPREIGMVYECLFCRGHAVAVVGVMHPEHFAVRPGWPGKPEDRQHEWLLERQELVAGRRFVLMPCPFCAVRGDDRKWRDDVSMSPRAGRSGKWAGDWAEWLQYGPGSQSSKAPTPLFPCRWVEYEVGSGCPLFRNDAPPGAKRKWVLCEGVGPQVLELANQQSGTVYKRCYRSYGLSADFVDCVEVELSNAARRGDEAPDFPDGGAVANASDLLQKVLELCETQEQAQELLASLFAHMQPLLRAPNWQKVHDELLGPARDDGARAVSEFLRTYPAPAPAAVESSTAAGAQPVPLLPDEPAPGGAAAAPKRPVSPSRPAREKAHRAQKREDKARQLQEAWDDYHYDQRRRGRS